MIRISRNRRGKLFIAEHKGLFKLGIPRYAESCRCKAKMTLKTFQFSNRVTLKMFYLKLVFLVAFNSLLDFLNSGFWFVSR